MYKENELISVAKRENNTKRSFLIVNKLQGKHIPVSPSKALAMFEKLGEIIEKEYNGERLLLVGFCETATAIGSAIAIMLNSFYIQTTRENMGNVDYLYFSESHSHATEQKIVENDIKSVINKIDRIIFIEDEITTGNTILSIVNIIKNKYSQKVDFSVASLINCMDENCEEIYKKEQIKTHYLLKTIHSGYSSIAEKFAENGRYFSAEKANQTAEIGEFTSYCVNSYCNARRLTKGAEYKKACESLWLQISKMNLLNSGKSVLVLGTEEFMYPALFVAKKLEEIGNDVKFHATTRSPIAVSNDENYPLHERYTLKSFYDHERVTFIYNLKKYDAVIIITDSKQDDLIANSSLINALRLCENENISVIRWL